eukprot:CAMPEP_0176453384 /NCGR_PEP_ID=MMETSP0127-20121128/29189_1 /TAXON_ID=938130 /ORGANISM="Platyophrya macrostoma, Strain WH" /LENGTH=74 /DNA_ID=CAMNT_0017842199 /DNA_START=66 /DNA_END=286 /DNA_ORIENTATION=+
MTPPPSIAAALPGSCEGTSSSAVTAAAAQRKNETAVNYTPPPHPPIFALKKLNFHVTQQCDLLREVGLMRRLKS